jgi:hypothetical protein
MDMSRQTAAYRSYEFPVISSRSIVPHRKPELLPVTGEGFPTILDTAIG